jgi:hypothetical protein
MSFIIAMFLTEMTLDDLMLLEQFRIERLRSLFAQSLLKCLMYVDRQHRLAVHCPEMWMVDAVLMDFEELCDYAWLTLGVKTIALFFVKEEICRIRCSTSNRATRMLLH